MKKTILLLASLLFTGLAVFSQDSSFGLKGGVNFASIGGDADGVENKVGFHAGCFGVIRASEKFAVQPELMFSRQGTQLSSNSDVKFHYDYLNLPLMFNVYPADNFFLQAGPQLGFLLAGKVKFKDESEDVKDQLNSTDFAACFGLGFDLKSAMINFRYNLGLSSTAKDDDGKYPNQVIQLSLGFKLN